MAYEDFAQSEVRRLQELYLAALEARIEADLRRGQHAAVVGELEALVIEHPNPGALRRSADARPVPLRTTDRGAGGLSAPAGATRGGARPRTRPAITALQTEILAHAPRLRLDDGAPVDGEPAGGLPAALTPTVGREGDIEAVCRLLTADTGRLVTLSGPGGVGKTRLALTVTHALKDAYGDGASWVELAGVAAADEVPAAMVRALGISPSPGETAVETLRRGLARQARLLVIDNFEHVLEASDTIGELHRSCPRLAILITSREALHLEGEHRYAVASLALPRTTAQTTPGEIEAASACAMFLAGVRRRDHTFTLSADAAPLVGRICARLDGLPLALELAAGRTDLLTLPELADELDIAVTTTGARRRDGPSRHRTLNATVDWSYQLLDSGQRSAFSAFAVFAGGASLTSAEHAVDCDRETLRALVAKSLLQRRTEPTGDTRLVMLEIVREYAAARLREGPDEPDVRQRHPLTAAPAIALRLAGAMGRYWLRRSDLSGLDWSDAAVAAAGPDADPADLGRVFLGRVPQLLVLRWETEAAVRSAETAVGHYRNASDAAGLAESLVALGVAVSVHAGDEKVGRPYCEEAIEHAQDVGADVVVGAALAHMAAGAGAGDDRLDAMDRAAVLLRGVGNFVELARYASNAAFVALTLQLEREHGYRFANEALVGISALAAAHRRDEIAACLLGAARAAGYPPAATEERLLALLERHSLTAARQRSGPQAWQTAEEAGTHLSFEESLTLAAEEISRLRAAAPEAVALTEIAPTPYEAPADR